MSEWGSETGTGKKIETFVQLYRKAGDCMLRVSELLEMKPFNQMAALVAGNQGLNKEIRFVTVMEAPDFPQWVNGGEFVLTTFFSVRDDVDKQVEIIRQLSEKKIAGLAIKVDRYINTIHPMVLEAAEKEKLPVFAVPREVKFRDLIQCISQLLIVRQEDSSKESDQFYDMIMKRVVNGESPEVLCQEIERYVGCTCAILSPNRERIAGTIRKDGMLRQLHNECEGTSEVDMVLDEFALQDYWMEDSLVYRHDPYVVVGCCVKGELICILLFSDIKNWGDRESVIAKRVAYAIGYRFLEEHIQKTVEQRMLSSFVDEIVFKGVDPAVFSTRAHFFGWTIYDCFQAIVVRHVGAEPLPPHAFQLVSDRWSRYLQNVFPSVIAVTKQEELIALVSMPSDAKVTEPEYHKEKLNEMLSLLFYRSPLAAEIRVGVGPVFADPALLKKSYLLARELITFMKKREGMLWYVSDYLLELLLLQTRDQVENKLIRKTVLEPLISYDMKHGTELLKSVKATLRFDSLEEAAESLFVHPNTLRNRLNKAAEVTGINPQKSRGKLMYLIALIDQL